MNEYQKYQEALERIKTNYCVGNGCNPFKTDCDCPFQVEVDIIQELIDKATPKKVKKTKGELPYYFTMQCPSCKRVLKSCQSKGGQNYCPRCGQKLDWSD